MKKRILPIPLILLIPIVLLVVVIVAGVYRFSLTDEEILAKFPSAQQQIDPVALAVFNVKATNPWTVKVPETHAFAFIDEYDAQLENASGRYDSGAERGVVTVDTAILMNQELDGQRFFFAPMTVSNQGSGVFHFLAQFKFDAARSRVILVDSLFLGDRVQITGLNFESDNTGVVSFLQHAEGEAMAESPAQKTTKEFEFNTQLIVER